MGVSRVNARQLMFLERKPTSQPILRLPQIVVEVSANYYPRTLAERDCSRITRGSHVNSAGRAVPTNSGELLPLLSKLSD